MVADNRFSSYCNTRYEMRNLVTMIRKIKVRVISEESLNNSYFLHAFEWNTNF
jgi:hypothetical protein